MQRALVVSHHNKDLLVVTATQMSASGHDWDTDPYLIKSKQLRRVYIKMRNARKTSGHVTCPFYEELDRILNYMATQPSL